jgi:hypothetical protein
MNTIRTDIVKVEGASEPQIEITPEVMEAGAKTIGRFEAEITKPRPMRASRRSSMRRVNLGVVHGGRRDDDGTTEANGAA